MGETRCLRVYVHIHKKNKIPWYLITVGLIPYFDGSPIINIPWTCYLNSIWAGASYPWNMVWLPWWCWISHEDTIKLYFQSGVSKPGVMVKTCFLTCKTVKPWNDIMLSAPGFHGWWSASRIDSKVTFLAAAVGVRQVGGTHNKNGPWFPHLRYFTLGYFDSLCIDNW